MKVCHINFAKGFRGGERQTLLLIQTLAKRSIPQILLARADSPLIGYVDGLSNIEVIKATKPYFKHSLQLNKLQPSVLHTHDAKAAQFAYLYYCIKKTPYMITRRMDRSPKNIWFTRMIYRNAIKVVALSRAIKDSLLSLDHNLFIDIIPDMYSCFSTNEKLLAELKLRYKNKFIVGHIGALVDYHKGQKTIIEAAKMLSKTHPNIKFLLLGQGQDETILKQLSAKLDNIEFVGFVDDVGTWIKLFDLFIFPSRQEGLGSSLLDVMRFGKPIIASDVGGITDVISNKENGLLIPVGDSETLARQIAELYANKAKRQQLADKARKDVERFSPEALTDQYLALYHSIK